MKKGLIILAVALLVIAGGLGFAAFKGLLPNPLGQASQVDKPLSSAPAPAAAASSSSSASASTYKEVNVMKPVKSAADILDGIDYEKTQNPDTVGWLYIPDTKISNSVLQSFDNVYYLRRNERKISDLYGCYFADYTCNFGTREQLSPNTVIYGHSDLTDQADGPRFSQLYHFTDEGFALRHPVVYFGTEYEVMIWQVFAAFYTDTDLVYNDAKVDLATITQQAKERSIYQYDVEVGAEDKILTLSTCTVKYGKEEKRQRFVVMAKLMPADYVSEGQASFTVNPNPVQPTFS